VVPIRRLFVAESEQQALVEEDFGDGGLDGNGAALRYSKRKFFALVNFLRVLQKLAKYNHHRCLLLIKFSAPVRPPSLLLSFARVRRGLCVCGCSDWRRQSTGDIEATAEL